MLDKTSSVTLRSQCIVNKKLLLPEAVEQRCSLKKVFLEISQNSQESICARVSFLIKLQALDLQLSHRIHIEYLWWLLLCCRLRCVNSLLFGWGLTN